MTDDEVDCYLARYSAKRKQLHAFFQLRLLIAHLVETIILVDRFVFLMEQVTLGLNIILLVK